MAVEVRPDALSLKAQFSEGKEEKGQTYHRRERVWRRYERLVPLPAEVVTDKAKASMKDGVLEVRMPKTAPSKDLEPTKVTLE